MTHARSYVSPRDLAAAVDVSESSLKRWADGGLLRVNRTAGGHRRIPISEAIRFVRETKLRLVDPAKIGLPDIGPPSPGIEAPGAAELEALFCDHCGSEAARRLIRAYLSGISVAELCDGPIRESLRRLGELYLHHADGIAIEHGAVDACSMALNSIRNMSAPPAGAPVAVGGAVEDDPYLLPTLSVAVVLEEIGFRAINLGPATPLGAVQSTLRREHGRLAWRSFGLDLSRADLDREIAGMQEAAALCGCDVALGGRATVFSPRIQDRLHAFSSLAELSGFARGILVSETSSAAAKR